MSTHTAPSSAALHIDTERGGRRDGPGVQVAPEPFVWAERALYGLSSGVVGCSVLVVLYGIGKEYAILQVHPVVLYVLLFFALTLLGYVEALHYSNVSIERHDMTPYAEKCAVLCVALPPHPLTIYCHRAATPALARYKRWSTRMN